MYWALCSSIILMRSGSRASVGTGSVSQWPYSSTPRTKVAGRRSSTNFTCGGIRKHEKPILIFQEVLGNDAFVGLNWLEKLRSRCLGVARLGFEGEVRCEGTGFLVRGGDLDNAGIRRFKRRRHRGFPHNWRSRGIDHGGVLSDQRAERLGP